MDMSDIHPDKVLVSILNKGGKTRIYKDNSLSTVFPAIQEALSQFVMRHTNPSIALPLSAWAERILNKVTSSIETVGSNPSYGKSIRALQSIPTYNDINWGLVTDIQQRFSILPIDKAPPEHSLCV